MPHSRRPERYGQLPAVQKMKIPFRRRNKVKLRTLLRKHGLEKVRIGPSYLQAEISLTDVNRRAAWELYVEMLTRIVTQPLPTQHGDDKTALDSIYSLFPTTRGILRRCGPETADFTKIAVPVLNQVVRPFTAKWHKLYLEGGFDDDSTRSEFRNELANLQISLRNYNRVLAEMAGVEDLTDLEEPTGEDP